MLYPGRVLLPQACLNQTLLLLEGCNGELQSQSSASVQCQPLHPSKEWWLLNLKQQLLSEKARLKPTG